MTDRSFEALREEVRAFTQARDWAQFHTPKNLVMALSVEASELMERFQWLTPEQSSTLDATRRTEVEQEIGDVMIYLIRLADVLEIDLPNAVRSKMRINETKYPVEKSRGIAAKYDELAK